MCVCVCVCVYGGPEDRLCSVLCHERSTLPPKRSVVRCERSVLHSERSVVRPECSVLRCVLPPKHPAIRHEHSVLPHERSVLRLERSVHCRERVTAPSSAMNVRTSARSTRDPRPKCVSIPDPSPMHSENETVLRPHMWLLDHAWLMACCCMHSELHKLRTHHATNQNLRHPVMYTASG